MISFINEIYHINNVTENIMKHVRDLTTLIQYRRVNVGLKKLKQECI